jgi:hypothetical protein
VQTQSERLATHSTIALSLQSAFYGDIASRTYAFYSRVDMRGKALASVDNRAKKRNRRTRKDLDAGKRNAQG